MDPSFKGKKHSGCACQREVESLLFVKPTPNAQQHHTQLV